MCVQDTDAYLKSTLLLAHFIMKTQHTSHTLSIGPAGDMEIMQQLTSTATGDGTSTLPNLEIVPSSNTDRVDQLLSKTDAFLMATDDVDSVLDPSIINYLLDPTKTKQLKRILAMSRNLNGDGMGMFVTASKKAANAQLWDNSNKAAYIEYENTIKQAAKNIGADYTIVRAGTLKGGSTGGRSDDDDDNRYYSQYLHESYYELTKNDLVTWQLLFDCNVRGVTLTKGDVQKGPGMQAVFTATGSEQHEGDTGRCGLAEAMVRSLEIEYAKNVDFGVRTVPSREVPSEEEWDKLFHDCLKH